METILAARVVGAMAINSSFIVQPGGGIHQIAFALGTDAASSSAHSFRCPAVSVGLREEAIKSK